MKGLFRKKSAALDRLREVMAENESDHDFQRSWSQEISALHRAFGEAGQAFASDPNPENLESLIQATIAKQRIQGLEEANRCGGVGISRRICERSRGPLVDALQDLIDRLNDSRAKLADEAVKVAGQFGVDEAETASPLVRKIDGDLEHAKDLLGKIDTLSANQVATAATWIFSHE